MLKLKKINRNNVGEILKLEVFDNQKSLVATNTNSIIEAYIARGSRFYNGDPDKFIYKE